MKHEEKRLIALMGCSHALSHALLLIFPAVLILLQKEFAMGYLGVGIIGNIMILAYGLGALPGGMVYDHFGPRKIYLLCFLGSAGASLLVALSSHFIVFTVGLALLGALGSVYHPLANSLITQRVEGYGRALGIHGAAGTVGVAAAPILAGLIASSWGWRQAYLWFGLLGVSLAVWSLFVDMPSPREKTKSTLPAPKENPGQYKLGVFFPLPLVLLYMVNMLNAFCFQGTITFLPTYMSQQASFRIFSLDNVAIGGMLSGIVLSIGILGQYTGGVLGTRSNLERNLALMGVLAFPFLLAMSFQTNIPLLMVAVTYYFINFCMQPMCNVLVARFTTPGIRGTAFGIFFFISSGVGSFSATFAGYLAQRFGLPWVFVGMSGVVVLLFILAVILWKAERPPLHPLPTGSEPC